MMVTRLIGELKEESKKKLVSLAKLVWRHPLDRLSSINLLQDSIIYQKKHKPFHLSDENPLNAPIAAAFSNKAICLNDDYVWKASISGHIKSIGISSSGTAIINEKQLLDLDFGCTAGLLDSPLKFETIELPIVIAPWSHFWGTYYDFIIFVLAKLCRIEAALGKEIWQKAKICYPLFNANYERQFLEKLGINYCSLIDTRKQNAKIQACQIILANNQRFFTPSPQDIQLLRNKFCLASTGCKKKRLFLSRRGRRKIKNETEVRDILRQFDFEIVEDIERTVDEQISLFKDASVIVSPHGGALTNILWSHPGTHVIELFDGSYTPPYYYYICKLLDMNYTSIISKFESERGWHWSNTTQNIAVDTEVLFKELKKIL